MSNTALAAFHGNSVASVSDLDAIMAKGAQNRPQVAAGNKPFLRLSPEGAGWLYGADNVQVEEASTWAVNPFSFQSGWVCWADPKKNGNRREKLGEVMSSIASPPPCPTIDHAARGGEWKEQFGFALVCVAGEDAGTEVVYQTDSYGGKQAFDAVYGEVSNRPSPEHCFPIVELLFDSYTNKAYGKKVYAPIFEVKDWANMQQELLSAGRVTKLETSEAGVKGGSDAPASEADAPLTRRRRSAA